MSHAMLSIKRLRALSKTAMWYIRTPGRFISLFSRLGGEGLNILHVRRIADFHSQYRRLVDFFHQPAHPLLGEVDAASPSIRFKMLFPYQRTGLSVQQRVDRLIEHYEVAGTLLGEALFRVAHIDPDGFIMCQVRLPGGHGVLPVRLMRRERSWREGELSIGLYDPFGTLIYTLTFSIFRNGERSGMFIGSLIGRTPPDNVKNLTKLMQGLRPQNLMLFLAQALCRYYSLEPLHAVARRGHVFSGTSLKERLHFDYDAFWREQGGELLPDDPVIYRLPTHPERRAETDIPSHKRAQYRRRFALMDDVEADMRMHLDDVRAGEPAMLNGTG